MLNELTITTDACMNIFISLSNKEYGFYKGTEHRTVKYLNNLIEQNHRPIKRHNKFYRSLRISSTMIKGMKTIRGLYKNVEKKELSSTCHSVLKSRYYLKSLLNA